MIIALTGYSGVGKDALAAMLVERDGFRRYAHADAVRELAFMLNPRVPSKALGVGVSSIRAEVNRWGWGQAKVQEPGVRAALQTLGESCREVLGEEVWVRALWHKVATDCGADWLNDRPTNWPMVITDVRYPNEAERARARGGLVVRITRPGVGPVNDHVSETAMDDYPVDATLNNNGTLDDLYRAAVLLLSTRPA